MSTYPCQEIIATGLAGHITAEEAIGAILGNLGPKTTCARPDFTNAEFLVGFGKLWGRLALDCGLDLSRISIAMIRMGTTPLTGLL